MIGKNLQNGFTLIELVVVMLIFSLLAGLSAPVVSSYIVRAREAVLKENLQVTRRAIDDYFADHGDFPESLEILVEEKYLRSMPWDPFVDSSEQWQLESSERADTDGVADIHSSSEKQAFNGSYYSEW